MQTNLARSLLFLAFVGLTAQAQEAEIEAMEPAVSSAELESIEPSLSGAELEQAGSDSIDPAVTGPQLEQTGVDAADATEEVSSTPRNVRRTASSAGVMDEIDLGRTEITGNQELPKVLYIVPWQKSDPGDLSGRPVNTLLDEVLAPIDRSEFIRQVDYYSDLYVEDEN